MSEKNRILNTVESPAKRPWFLAKITILARVWAIVTLAVMWAAGITTVQLNDINTVYIGWYLIAASALISILEILWVIDKSACCRREGCCCKCWSVCMWIDNWKKGILYIALSIPVFLEGMRIILGVVSGFLLIICGCLYIVKTFKDGIVYTVTETRYVKTYTPSVHTVSHTVSTQTEDDKYYAEVQSTEWGTESPSVTQREQFTH